MSPVKYKAPTFAKSQDEKKTVYKDNTKGFTLTDHFKLYREKQKTEEKEWMTEKYESEGSAKQISDISSIVLVDRTEKMPAPVTFALVSSSAVLYLSTPC